MTPFTYIDSLQSQEVIDDMSEYNAFVINRHLSYFMDAVLLVNELNLHPDMSDLMQYLFLLNIIRPQKRFTKWSKEQEYKDLDMVCRYYGYNRQHGKQALMILTNTQVDDIRHKMMRGGLVEND